MTYFRFILTGAMSCLAIFLFVSAPTPLPDGPVVVQQSRLVHSTQMFNAANAVNEAARHIYTSRIVGPGLKAGLSFGEDWAEPNVDKGPLPALFLRLVAQRLEAKPTRLSLYLGSDEPINKSNLFDADQMITFETLKASGEPVIAELPTAGFVGMYPDVASAAPCVRCHNEHDDSPKKDWVLNDIMGATTWTYPTAQLGAGDYLSTTEQVFEAISEAYSAYLEKIASFETEVIVGEGWPDGPTLMIPKLSVFMAEVRNAASVTVVDELVLISSELDQAEIEN